MYVVRAKRPCSNSKHWTLCGFDGHDGMPCGDYEPREHALRFTTVKAAQAAIDRHAWLFDCEVVPLKRADRHEHQIADDHPDHQAKKY